MLAYILHQSGQLERACCIGDTQFKLTAASHPLTELKFLHAGREAKLSHTSLRLREARDWTGYVETSYFIISRYQ